MKTIILSAGQGKRLLPLTAKVPKCLLPIKGKTLIEWQIDELAKCGIEEVTVVTGYHAKKVEILLHGRYGYGGVRTLYNAAYAKTDNLVSCWAASGEMTENFILLNGDTLFDADVLDHLLRAPARPVTVAVSHKNTYDADDMKVCLDDCRLVKIGKKMASEDISGESIGMILFRGQGPKLFCSALKKALENPDAQKKWYLSVIDDMAQSMPVWTCSIHEEKWCEVDCEADLKTADQVVSLCAGNGRGNVCSSEDTPFEAGNRN